MKQLISFITRLFSKRKNFSSLFADAWEEGISDTLKERDTKQVVPLKEIESDNV